MIQEDLEALHGMLRRIEPDQKVMIANCFICSARELDWVVEEALSSREQAKMAGTFEPYTPSLQITTKPRIRELQQ